MPELKSDLYDRVEFTEASRWRGVRKRLYGLYHKIQFFESWMNGVGWSQGIDTISLGESSMCKFERRKKTR